MLLDKCHACHDLTYVSASCITRCRDTNSSFPSDSQTWANGARCWGLPPESEETVRRSLRPFRFLKPGRFPEYGEHQRLPSFAHEHPPVPIRLQYAGKEPGRVSRQCTAAPASHAVSILKSADSRGTVCSKILFMKIPCTLLAVSLIARDPRFPVTPSLSLSARRYTPRLHLITLSVLPASAAEHFPDYLSSSRRPSFRNLNRIVSKDDKNKRGFSARGCAVTPPLTPRDQ